MTDHPMYSDEQLRDQIGDWDGVSRNGYARAATALLRVEGIDARRNIDGEARIRTNVCGGIYSYAVESQVEQYLRGDHTFPYVEANLAMLQREREERERTGIFRPESIDQAFRGMPHRRR